MMNGTIYIGNRNLPKDQCNEHVIEEGFMKVLMIGGTGIISTATTEKLVNDGVDLWLLNRGNRPSLIPEKAHVLMGDITDEKAMLEILKGMEFDVVVDWMVFTPEQAERDIRYFTGRTKQYIFISSGSAYQRPSQYHIVTETTPLENPFSEYARNKASTEAKFLEAYHQTGFPVTIVRPSLTYGNLVIPYVLNSWHQPWTLIHRLKEGKRIIVPGDGTSLWELTHNTDFAKGITGLFGLGNAIGEAFHITSGEVMTWEAILNTIANAVGCKAKVVHISSDFICHFMPGDIGGLIGDKISSVIYDNSKIKQYVPAYKATTPFYQGIHQTIEYLENHPEKCTVDAEYEKKLDRVIAAYDYGPS